MIDDVSPAVERALEAARKQAGDSPLDAVRLFLALIEDDEGRAAQVLTEAGGDLTAVRDALAGHSPLPFDLAAVLTGARQGAGDGDETTATGEDLLFGLVRAGEGFHVALRAAGVHVDRLTRPMELPPLAVGTPLDISDTGAGGSAARVVDANANRARESLRVLDDYVRFVLDDRTLTEEVKGLRHELAAVLGRLPA